MKRSMIFLWGFGAIVSLNAAALSPDIAVSKSGRRIPYSSMKLNDLGPKTIDYDTAGMRTISPAPPPGVHPRMLHSPEDRDALEAIYKETEYGRTMWKMLLGFTDKLKGKIGRDRSMFPRHPNGALMASYERGGWTEVGDQYKKILAGDMSGYEVSMNDCVLGSMAMEAYRCWIEDDKEAGAALCVAIEHVCDYLKDRVKPGQHPGAIGAHNMGFCYDYAYNFMTDGQRRKVRDLIAVISRNKAHYGAFLEPDATTSNWCALDSFMALTLMAIEGEEGFNENYWKGLVRAYHNFMTYGWYASGCPYEGLGKNYQFNTTMILFAKRGVDMIGHPHVRAYGEKFLPGVSLPNGRGFLGCDDWGGTGSDTVLGNFRFNVNDAIGLKWLFPNSKPIDYVWRIYMGQNYERYRNLRTEGYFNSALMAVMFPSASMMRELDAEEAGIDKTLFCPERGYMTTRSDLGTNALFLTLHCRQDKGGHTSADRNHFTFSALGRLWGISLTLAGGSKFGKVNESRFFSTVLIDDVGQCGMASGCFPVPGNMVDFKDTDDLTYATGDAKYAYDWTWSWEDGDPAVDSPKLDRGWTKVEETPNDFQYQKQPYPYMNKPFYMQHHWLAPGKVQHYVKKPWNPVKKAYRTAAMVRGEHPYVLMIDDIQAADGKEHQYKWLMQVSRDLEILKFDFSDTSDICDIYLCGREVPRDEQDVRKPRKGDPMLLVRILQCNNNMARRRYTPIGRLEQYMSNIRWPNTSGKRLVIPSYAIAPDYKIMLYPHRYGDKLPKTQWLDKEKTRLSIAWHDQEDLYTFHVDAAGKTGFALNRNPPAL